MRYPLPQDPIAALRAGLRNPKWAPLFAGKTAEEVHELVDCEREGLNQVIGGVEYTVISLAHLWGRPRGFFTDEIREALQ